MIMKKFAFILMLAGILMTACSSDKNDEPEFIDGGGDAVLANTVIYKLNGDYANLVSVQLDESRSMIEAFADPFTASITKIIKLSDGFYCGGTFPSGGQAAFLRWTYEEFAKFTTNFPNPEYLFKNIVPEARITLEYKLPRYDYLDPSHPEFIQKCNELIEAGLPGCELIYKLEE